VRPDHAGHRESERQAVPQREAGDDEHEIAQTAGDQHQAEQEGLMIHAGEDVRDTHHQILAESRVLQAVLLIHAAHVDARMVRREQLFDHRAVLQANLREIGVGGHPIEECVGSQAQVRRVGAAKLPLDAAISGRRCDGPRRLVERAFEGGGAHAHVLGEVGDQRLVAGIGAAVRRQPAGLEVRNGELQADRGPGDLPGRVRFAARVRLRPAHAQDQRGDDAQRPRDACPRRAHCKEAAI
jgi:hypothetical protein